MFFIIYVVRVRISVQTRIYAGKKEYTETHVYEEYVQYICTV